MPGELREIKRLGADFQIRLVSKKKISFSNFSLVGKGLVIRIAKNWQRFGQVRLLDSSQGDQHSSGISVKQKK
jgi:hypothetical protein